MPDIVRYIRQDPTAKVEFNSNGEMVTEEKAIAVLEAGIDVMRFSIDGTSQETYNKTRPGIDYEKTEKNVRRFLELVREKNSMCETYVRCIDMPETKGDQEKFLKLWSPLADHVVITPLYDWPWSGQTESVLKPCLKVIEEMFFLTDGRAVLCCWDFDARAVVGDVKTNTLQELWAGAKNQQYRDLLAKGRRDKIKLCSRCDAYKNHVFPGFDGVAADARVDLTDTLV